MTSGQAIFLKNEFLKMFFAARLNTSSADHLCHAVKNVLAGETSAISVDF